MGSLSDLARHWSRQSEKGKGIRIEADGLDVLNANGVGELILKLAAEEQREKCNLRLKSSTREARYRLAWDRRADGSLRTPYLQVVWYDLAARRNRSRSTGTEDLQQAEDELDRFFLKRERGQAICPECGQQIRGGARHLVTSAIADYLLARESKPSIGAMRARLAHVTRYLGENERLATSCEEVDEDWIETFREWVAERPIVSPTGIQRERSPGTVEASVRQLAAAINFAHGRKDTLYPAAFAAKAPEEVSRSPVYRADVAMLAKMFRYCVAPATAAGEPIAAIPRLRSKRAQLHRFLQISVATWARPDAAHDVSTKRDRDQWHSNARALNLNQRGRPQTKKHRPIVPIGSRVASLLDADRAQKGKPVGDGGFYVTVSSVRTAFRAMQAELGLPGQGEAGMKLIRRSMAHIARQRLGERDWVEGQIMLGHRRPSTSDTYAPFDAGYLGRALEVTDDIIGEIEKLCPGSFAAAADSNPPSDEAGS